jgi:serine protease Do
VQQLAEYGETRRGWLGVRIQPVTDEVAESLSLPSANGALVSGIIKGGPVDHGEILPGDVIVKFDGHDIEAMHELPRVVAESPVGKDVEIIVIRKGKEQAVHVKLGRLEDSDKLASAEESQPEKAAPGETNKPTSSNTVLGMSLGELDDATREKFKIAADVAGVVVTEVEPGSAAAEKGIAAGDVITEITQQTVSKPKDVSERITALKGQGRKAALLMLASKSGELRFVTVRIDG